MKQGPVVSGQGSGAWWSVIGQKTWPAAALKASKIEQESADILKAYHHETQSFSHGWGGTAAGPAAACRRASAARRRQTRSRAAQGHHAAGDHPALRRQGEGIQAGAR